MIDIEKIDKQIEMIESKDLDDIVAKNTYIPYLGHKYTKEELQTWLNKRTNYLESLKTMKEEDLLSNNTDTFTLVSTETKTLVDKIIADEKVEYVTEQQWEDLVLLRIERSVTT